MSGPLTADCLNEMLEYLEDDKVTLHSCLLVNIDWCKASVRILWRNVWNLIYDSYDNHKVERSIINTLVSCLPNESKDLLYKNNIGIKPPWRSPILNYASYCKVLPIREIVLMIKRVLKNQLMHSQYSKYSKYLITQELFKMFMNQITSLKSLDYRLGYIKQVQNVTFTYFSGAKNCLKDLSEFKCDSNIYFEVFYQLSQICHNIESMSISFKENISDGLADLISSQKNLKQLKLMQSHNGMDWSVIIPSMKNLSTSLTKLALFGENNIPMSFISLFTNLQEIIFSFEHLGSFDDFSELQHVRFPHLKVLKFKYECPKYKYLNKFLEVNGMNLKEFNVNYDNDSLNFSIAKYCPNLKSLFTIFIDNDVKTFKSILESCQQLESIKVLCGDEYLNEKHVLNIIAKYSPKSFHTLKLYNEMDSDLLPIDLENFLINWEKRVPKLSLSLIVIKSNRVNSLENNEENMRIIEKYKKLGVIEKFRIDEFNS
ncbi:13027_t:CDS:1 [Funneliformis geosporum]|uniref:13027_t:CDS:1 n=1 Tax=Funneliformis geosporum TaxID=1117311 RepID=A0A9W4WHP5_9GLOM|nr:13027_t:CDS:1 [Funneliformis geosporum]